MYTAMTIYFLIAYISASEPPNNIYLLGRLALIRLLHIVMGEPIKSIWTVTCILEYPTGRKAIGISNYHIPMH